LISLASRAAELFERSKIEQQRELLAQAMGYFNSLPFKVLFYELLIPDHVPALLSKRVDLASLPVLLNIMGNAQNAVYALVCSSSDSA